MTASIIGNVEFPEFTGVKCYMMPFIQGDPESLPDEFSQYSSVIERSFLSIGEVGYITIDESYVHAGKSQRGYGNSDRTLHTEACRSKSGLLTWGRPTWGGTHVFLDDDLEVLVANSVDDTCMVWDADVTDTSEDGDLGHVADLFPRTSGIMMKRGQVAKMGIYTPHECINQNHSGNRQFFRVVGSGLTGFDPKFTRNPKLH